MMPGVNYVIYGSSSARATPGLSVITQDRVIDDIWKGKLKLKTKLCVLVDYS